MATGRKHGGPRAKSAKSAKSATSAKNANNAKGAKRTKAAKRGDETAGRRVHNAATSASPPNAYKPSAAPVPAPLAPRFHRYALPRSDDGVRYWLFKTEPDVFSFDDLMRAPQQTTFWDGVRNFQVRNFMRDHMAVGDLVFIYHSNAEPPAVVGIARVASKAYPDHTAFDASHDHFDPKSDPAFPTWMMVDVQAVRALQPVTLPALRDVAGLEGMELLQRGSRLSITPLTADEWAIVERLGS